MDLRCLAYYAWNTTCCLIIFAAANGMLGDLPYIGDIHAGATVEMHAQAAETWAQVLTDVGDSDAVTRAGL